MQEETLHKQRDRRLLKLISIGVIVVIIVIFILLFIAQRPMRQAQEQSVNSAKRTEGIENANSFYKSDLDHVYYTVGGHDKRGHDVYVIMNKHHKPIRVVSINHGISRAAIVHRVKFDDHAKKIMDVSPAVFDGKTVWIASYENHNRQLCYHTFEFDTGKSLQSITNV